MVKDDSVDHISYHIILLFHISVDHWLWFLHHWTLKCALIFVIRGLCTATQLTLMNAAPKQQRKRQIQQGKRACPPPACLQGTPPPCCPFWSKHDDLPWLTKNVSKPETPLHLQLIKVEPVLRWRPQPSHRRAAAQSAPSAEGGIGRHQRAGALWCIARELYSSHLICILLSTTNTLLNLKIQCLHCTKQSSTFFSSLQIMTEYRSVICRTHRQWTPSRQDKQTGPCLRCPRASVTGATVPLPPPPRGRERQAWGRVCHHPLDTRRAPRLIASQHIQYLCLLHVVRPAEEGGFSRAFHVRWTEEEEGPGDWSQRVPWSSWQA